MAALATIFVIWAGINWNGDILGNALPVYWPTIGAVASIVLGSLSGVYVGTITLHAIYAGKHKNYWNPDIMKERLHFADEYGGIMYHLVRIWEMGTVTLWISIAIGLAAAPYYLALELQDFLNENAASADQVMAQGYKLLSNGLVLLLGSWASAYTLTSNTDDVLRYYQRIFEDILNTTEDTRDEIRNGDIIYDLIMHGAKSLVIALMGFFEALMTWAYVYYQFAGIPYGTMPESGV